MEVSSGALRERKGAAFIGELDRLALDIAALAAPSEATQLAAERGKRVSQIQPRGRAPEQPDGLLKEP